MLEFKKLNQKEKDFNYINIKDNFSLITEIIPIKTMFQGICTIVKNFDGDLLISKKEVDRLRKEWFKRDVEKGAFNECKLGFKVSDKRGLYIRTILEIYKICHRSALFSKTQTNISYIDKEKYFLINDNYHESLLSLFDLIDAHIPYQSTVFFQIIGAHSLEIMQNIKKIMTDIEGYLHPQGFNNTIYRSEYFSEKELRVRATSMR